MKITKLDILWNYAGSIFNLAISIAVFPFVLSMLQTDELGLWYVFGSIAALIQLLDFGFSPTMMRNIIYAWSGADKLHIEGSPDIENESVRGPNYTLLKSLIQASKNIYLLIAVLAGAALVFIGTPYVYYILETVRRTYLMAWGIYAIAIVINIYYSYWSPLLKGIGAIKEANQAQVLSKVIYLVFTIIGLLKGGGLLWLSCMYLVSGVILRVVSKIFFMRISKVNESEEGEGEFSSREILRTIWPNAKKLGLVTLGAWLITRSTILICSAFFGLEVTAQYGLSVQLLTFIGGFAGLLFNSYLPEITSSKVSKDENRYKVLFARSIFIQWLVNILGIVAVVFIAPIGLEMIGSNSDLLPRPVLIVLCIVLFLEWNHSTFGTLITLENTVPFVKAALLSGAGIVILALILAQTTDLGVLGLVLAQGFVQLLYNNWYWPRYIMKRNSMSLLFILKSGFHDTIKFIRWCIRKIVAR